MIILNIKENKKQWNNKIMEGIKNRQMEDEN